MKKYSLILVITITFLSSCEKVIPVKLDSGTSQLTVDAFLDDKPGTQKVRLTMTGAYFDNVPNPAVTGATVKLSDNQGHTYSFVDNANSGDYSWTPTVGDTLFRLFNNYTLSVVYKGDEFQATSTAYPSPPIDSVTYTPLKNASGKSSTTGYSASFYARDIEGMANFYWIKSYKNGVFYSKPGQMNLSQDGAFSGETDGLTFIYPIRVAIVPDSLNINDSVTVNIYAINPETYFFLNEVVEQTTNSGLFATPPSNVSTNIKNVTSGSKTKPVGWFNIGAASIGGVRVK